MKKRTVISSHIDWNKHTAYVKNQGIEELKLFKQLKDNGIELKDDEMSDEEICMLLNHLCIDGIIESVFSIENHFNRDQSTINKAKNNIEEKLKAKGLEIVTHYVWEPSFSNGGDTVNLRNYLTILNENINKKELKLNNLEDECLKQEEIINNNSEKIKKQNWYIEQSKNYESEYNKQKKLFDELVERYKNGEKYIKELELKLPDEFKELLKTKENINKEINELRFSIKEYNSEINKQKEIITKYNNNICEINKKINDIISSLIINNLPIETAKEKFKMTVRMYLLNGRNIPEFEKEYARTIGLDENTIKEIINIFK